MIFEFATAQQIVFGRGMISQVGRRAAALGRRALVVTGSRPERADRLLGLLAAEQLDCCIFPVTGEPTLAAVAEGVELARQCGCEVVIGFGGGSALDAGKAIAALLTNGGHPLDYLEIIGRGESLRCPSAPCIAIPTTAGTGTEVTRNAVLASPEHRLKASLRSPLMLPTLAVIDPDLSHTLPPDQTAATGLDALTQLIEPFVSTRANPLIDALCRDGMGRIARSLRRAVASGDDGDAREDMALAALYSGLALANAGLGAVHGFAGPLGGMFNSPHGAVCGALLPHVMMINIQALRDRDPQGVALVKYAEISRILTGNPDAGACDAVRWVKALCRDLSVPKLSAYGIAETDLVEIIERSARASSMQTNPVRLAFDELRTALLWAL